MYRSSLAIIQCHIVCAPVARRAGREDYHTALPSAEFQNGAAVTAYMWCTPTNVPVFSPFSVSRYSTGALLCSLNMLTAMHTCRFCTDPGYYLTDFDWTASTWLCCESSVFGSFRNRRAVPHSNGTSLSVDGIKSLHCVRQRHEYP